MERERDRYKDIKKDRERQRKTDKVRERLKIVKFRVMLCLHYGRVYV